ncbi:MAG: preprotein translocase subunit YajC [Gemmatimonadales bacterium]|nr:MAG: preprotein translocase subunit YajC [Gemmatimonadales bacterium]
MVQIALIFLIFYWLLIRPQRKEAERHREMVAALRKNDDVITDGGIVGTVVHLTEDQVTIRTGENTRIVLERSKVARKLGDPAEA